MSSPPPDDGQRQGRLLSAALKTLRRHRRLRPADVADAMNMPLRSYEYFEAGQGRLNLDRIHQFAQATNTDAYAILASLTLESSDFAVRCADNKLLATFMMALEDFNAATGDNIARLEARTIIVAFTRAFVEMTEHLKEQDAFAHKWRTRLRGPPDDAENSDE